MANSVLGVLRLPSGTHILSAIAGVNPEWQIRIAEFNSEVVDLWGGQERIQQYPLDEPIIQSEAVGHAEMSANRYYREWVEPQGLFDAVVIGVSRDRSMVGSVAFGRHRSAGEIGEREMSGLRLLAPHFRRAIVISNLFDMKAIETATFASALDSFAFGVVLVDESLSIVHANTAAEAMLAAGEPIRSAKGALTLRSKAAHAALGAAVRRAASDEATLGQRGIGIPAPRASGDPCVIHVLPLRRGEIRRGLAQRATAALFVAPANAPPQMPTDALALLYDLTPAEARIFELVCAGRTQAEIGEHLGIARSTVKTHLLHVFQKTGCKRQLELTALAARLSLPV